MPKIMNSQGKKCSRSSEVELYLLKKAFHKNGHRNFEKHLRNCHYCQQILSELKIFYRCLFKTFEEPVSNSVFTLLKYIEDNDIIFANIMLKPHFLDEEPGKRHFTSELILKTYETANIQVADYSSISLNKDEILIRAIQSAKTYETTLFLYSKNKKLYSNIIFDLPTLDKSFHSDQKGKIEIGNIDIGHLNNLDVMITSNF